MPVFFFQVRRGRKTFCQPTEISIGKFAPIRATSLGGEQYELASFATVRLPNFHGYIDKWHKKDALQVLAGGVRNSDFYRRIVVAASQLGTDGTVLISMETDENGSVDRVEILDSDTASHDEAAEVGRILSEYRIDAKSYVDDFNASNKRLAARLPEGVEAKLMTEEEARSSVADKDFVMAIHRYKWIAGDHKNFPVDGGLPTYGTRAVLSAAQQGVLVEIF